ncbi:MAG: chorismate synthase [Nitrospirae bacterium]|nr:chorismate synthase [Nitrospirota bacterium]
MTKLRFTTTGESHGPALCGVIEGIPSNLNLSADDINRDLARRQKGYGRGGRMKIETDAARILSGVRWGKTLGSPVALLIENRDWANWEQGMSADETSAGSIPAVTRPRPGHADLVGAIKYDHADARNVLERSSARETAMRVALGAIAKRFLDEFGIRVTSFVRGIGPAHIDQHMDQSFDTSDIAAMFERAENSDVRCPDEAAANAMRREIDRAIEGGYSLGGIFDVVATGVPLGLGDFTQWDKRLNSRLAAALMGVQAIKGVEVGIGFEAGRRPGPEVMDEIFYGAEGYSRGTNRSGGIEGGMSNGMPIVLRAAMKPIPTQRHPLASVDMATHEPVSAAYERSDVCAVPAAAVVCEAMVALVLADEMLVKFGGDSMAEISRNLRGWLDYIKTR